MPILTISVPQIAKRPYEPKTRIQLTRLVTKHELEMIQVVTKYFNAKLPMDVVMDMFKQVYEQIVQLQHQHHPASISQNIPSPMYDANHNPGGYPRK
jgi:hypothetical protein